MKKFVCALIMISSISFAFAGQYKLSAYRTHSVRAYRTKKGVYHKSHISGNPGSGVHCHNNICR